MFSMGYMTSVGYCCTLSHLPQDSNIHVTRGAGVEARCQALFTGPFSMFNQTQNGHIKANTLSIDSDLLGEAIFLNTGHIKHKSQS